MKNKIRWVIWSLAVWTCAVGWLAYSFRPAWNLLRGYMVFSLIISFICFVAMTIDEVREKTIKETPKFLERSVPKWLNFIFDLPIGLALLYFGFFGWATVWFARELIGTWAGDRAEEERKKIKEGSSNE